MSEALNKFLIYFKKDVYSYWQLSDNKSVEDFKLKKYPLSIQQRILEGHYPGTDENGIPVLEGLYHYTTICSFGLGNWELFLDTRDEQYLDRFRAIADYLLDNISAEGAFIQAAFNRHKAGPSAMIQGEAISVLTRMWEWSQEEKYLAAALAALGPFQKNIDKGGIVVLVSTTGLPWYEEYTDDPLFHVLNGKMYSLWGLLDLCLISNDDKAKQLLDQGLDSLEAHLHLFDNGFWSLYWHPENGRSYIASLMYHNLHICQLQHTYKVTQRAPLKEYADRFLAYSNSYTNRFRSGYHLLSSKLQKKLTT
ncbi:MAG: D-glucuronyl C5-epimerase family protein [Bacteroidota bacterium]